MLTYKIVTDADTVNPRTEYENLGTMALYHRRRNLGDKNKPEMEEVKDIIEQDDIIGLKVYGYEHGGLTIRTSPFGCPWDSGTLGYIYASKDDAEKAGVKWEYDNIVKILESEVKTYDNYLQGNCWGYKIINESGETVDSCYGFLGDDIKSSGVMESYNKDIHRLVGA